MRQIGNFLILVIITLLVSCRRPETPTLDHTSYTNEFDFEGVYCVTNDNDRSPVTFQHGRYKGALPANPNGDMNGAGNYSVHTIDGSHWELQLTFDTGGCTTLAVHRDGDAIWIRDKAYGGETKLIRKQP